MPCFAKREYVSKPLFYTWSAARLCKPKDNLLCHHQCDDAEKKPVKKPSNFMQKNREAIAKYREEFVKKQRYNNKMGDGLKLRAKAVVKAEIL